MDQSEIEKKYNESPQKIKDFLSAQSTVDALTVIGKKYGLQIDSVGVIEEAITLFVLGIIDSSEFDQLIKHSAAGDREMAEKIILDINNSLISQLRNNESIQSDQKISADTPNDERSNILSAIENPTPVVHPISIAQPKPSEKMRPSSGDGVAREFVGEKLVAPVSLPSQKIVVPPTPAQPVAAVAKPKPALDPYREPIE